MRAIYLLSSIFLPLILSCTAMPPTQPQTIADLVLHNGVIYTVNQQQPWAEALAVKEGHIIFVGDDTAIDSYIGEATNVIDLAGRMVLPGIHDSHMHPLEAASPVGGTCILEPDTDPEEYYETLQECAPKQLGTNWVLGGGFSVHNMLETERLPVRILDEAIPNRPAALMEETSHAMWVNTRALEAANITADTADPPGGVIDKDEATGKPTGLLFDNAGDLVLDIAFTRSAEMDELHYEGLLDGLAELAKNGITSVADARVYWKRGYLEAWQRAEAEDALTVRAVLGLWAYPHEEDATQLAKLVSLYSNDANSLLRVSQVKMYSDGILINGTAALLEPYVETLGMTGNTGLNYFDEARLTRYVTELERVGFDLHIHTIGDRAVRESLNAIEAAKITNGDGIDRRHRLTHIELVDAADRPRFAELGVIADFQVAGDFTLPEHASDMEPLIGDRAYDMVPVRSIYDTGATVTLSSDWDVSELSPFIGVQHSLQRETQSLPDLDAAIRAYTINAAYLMRQEARTGSLEVGKLADLIVIDQNLFEVAVDEIGQTTVLLTLLAGQEVFRNPILENE